MKKVIYINIFILIGLVVITLFSNVCSARTIYVNETVYFHTDNATFNVTGNIPFHSLTRTNDYMKFNFTRFYVTGDVNITLDYLRSDMSITGFHKLLSYYTNNTSWFNITGFTPNTIYSVYVDYIFFVNVLSNATGVINFLIPDTSSVYVEIYSYDAPEVFGDINTTVGVYTTMYMAGFLLFVLGIFRRNLTFTGCSFVMFIILWIQSINISVPFISVTGAAEYTLGNQQHLDPAVGASCWLFIIIDIIIIFYYFLGWWQERRGEQPAMP